jgi:hypothetical protein
MFRSNKIVSIILAMFLTITFTYPMDTSAQIGAATSALTVGQFIQSMQSFVTTLENSAHSLLEQGNAIAAQQQLLLAGTLQGTIRQLREAYKGSMDKTFDGLETQQGNAFKRLQAVVQDASRLENRSASDLNQIVSNTQDAANQLMDRMPLTDKSPVYFGIQTRDVLASFDSQPNDIVLTGYHLVDQRLNNKKPDIQIAVGGRTYDITKDHPDYISAQFNRVNITLPDDLKKAIRIDNQPCEPMRLFHLTGTVYYKGGWFNTDQNFTFNANMSPGERLYAVKVIIDGARTAPQPVQSAFSNASGEQQVGCDATTSTQVSWTGPDNARQVVAQAEWFEGDGLGSVSSTAAASGNTATATGSVHGRSKQCVFGVCNCPGGGHAKLRVFGSYVVDQVLTTPFHDEREVVHINPTHVSIPSETILALNTVDVQITRKGCSQVLDSIHIAVPSDRNKVVQATSANGYFEATLQPGQLDISTTSHAPDADHH